MDENDEDEEVHNNSNLEFYAVFCLPSEGPLWSSSMQSVPITTNVASSNLAHTRCFSLGTPISSTNITEILLKVTLTP